MMMMEVGLISMRKLPVLLIVLVGLLCGIIHGQQDDKGINHHSMPSLVLMPPPPWESVWSKHLPSTKQDDDAPQRIQHISSSSSSSDDEFQLSIPIAVDNKDQKINTMMMMPDNNIINEAADNNKNNNTTSSFEDYDDYVPYNSDEFDHFSWTVLRNIIDQEKEKNVVFSPFAVKLLMAIIAEAAGENSATRRELYAALEDGIKSPENLRGFYRKLLYSVRKENPYHSLELETRLFADKHIVPKQKYAALLKNFYNTSIDVLNFTDVDRSVKHINDWAAMATKGHITELVNRDIIVNGVVILADGLYFTGNWRKQFNITQHERPFYLQNNEPVPIKYMQQTDYFYYHDDEEMNARIIRLPYLGRKLAMFIVLPKTIDGLDDMIYKLKSSEVKRMQFLMEEVKLEVHLPKFKFEYNKDVKEILHQMGIRELFTDSASLPGLDRMMEEGNGGGQLKVSSVVQKTGIVVDEEGSEAYVSTFVEIDNKFGGALQPDEFNANHPFMFFIEEEATGTILFAGKVLDPRAS